MADHGTHETEPRIAAGSVGRSYRDGLAIETVIGGNGVHESGIIPEQRKLKRAADEKRPRVDDGKKEDTVVGNECLTADDTELKPGMIIDEGVFPDIGKPDHRIGSDLGALFDDTAFDDGRGVHVGFRVNRRHRRQHLELVDGTGFGERHDFLPETHLLELSQSGHIRRHVGQRQMQRVRDQHHRSPRDPEPVAFLADHVLWKTAGIAVFIDINEQIDRRGLIKSSGRHKPEGKANQRLGLFGILYGREKSGKQALLHGETTRNCPGCCARLFQKLGQKPG